MKDLVKDMFQHNKGITGKGSDGNQAWLAERKIRKETEHCHVACMRTSGLGVKTGKQLGKC